MPTIQTETLRTYYELSGEGETIVFIHGLGSSSQDWYFQRDFFAEHFQVLTYDVRGHGQSEKPAPPYSVETFSADLAALLKALEIKKAHFVGLSMGGWIAFQFAVDYPEMVETLTIVNSWADMRPKNLQDWSKVFQRIVLFNFFSMRKIGETVGANLFIKPEQKELLDGFIESWAKNHKPSYMASFKAGIKWSVADRLDEITAPVLVIAADEDYSTVESKQVYADKISDARLVVIEDSRHATPVERPNEFNRVLFEFLRSPST